jgi:hypothetical protein
MPELGVLVTKTMPDPEPPKEPIEDEAKDDTVTG